MAKLEKQAGRRTGKGRKKKAAGLLPLASPEPGDVIRRNGRPWLTLALATLLVAIFAAEHLFAVIGPSGSRSPSPATLAALGGFTSPLVLEHGQWYRLFTATFLHVSIIHLVFNGVSLVLAGAFLENRLGRAWLLALFTLSALGGAVLSLAVHRDNSLNAGASAAVMGLFAATALVAFRVSIRWRRVFIQVALLLVLLLSLLPLGRGGPQIDYAAHLGGALIGGLVGFALLLTWPRDTQLPRFRGVARAIAAAGVVLFIVGFALVRSGYRAHADAAAVKSFEALLVPASWLPSDTQPTRSQAKLFATRYPRDPRALMAHALYLDGDGHHAKAQALMWRALEEREILRLMFSNRRLETQIRGYLAKSLLDEDKREQAEQVAAPACSNGESEVSFYLHAVDLCR